MHKAFSVNLAGIVFNMNEDAYKKLAEYLEQIKKYFARNPDKEDIIADIENSIADKFSGKLSPKKYVITLNDVNQVIKKLGTVKEFEYGDREGDNAHYVHKKLFKDSDNIVVDGVCAGLAAYVGVEPLWVRILFGALLLTPLAGVVILTYIILMVSVPRAKTGVDKMEMRGEPITLSTIESTIKNSTSTMKKEHIVAKIILLPFRIVVKLLYGMKVLLPFIGKICAGFLLFVMAIVIFAVTFAGSALVFVHNKEYMALPIKNFPATPIEYGLIIACYFVILIPLMLIFLVCLSAFKKKNILSGGYVWGIIGLWGIALITTSMLLLNAIPGLTQPSRQIVPATDSVRVKDFKNIDVRGDYRLQIQQGPVYSVEVNGRADYIHKISIVREGDTLFIKPLSHLCIVLCFTDTATIRVVMPTLEKVYAQGAITVDVYDFQNEPSMIIQAGGSSDISLTNIHVHDLTISSSGSSDIRLSGDGENLSLDLHGSSDVDAEGYRAMNATVRARGASDVKLDAQDTLRVDLSGASNVFYKGNPRLEQILDEASEVHKSPEF